MKSIVLCCVLLVAASSAWAGGLGLRWTNCEGDGGVQNLTFACNSNTGNQSLAASVTLDTDLLAVLSDELVLDISTAGGVLAPWWELRTPLGAAIAACRNGAISIASQDGASCPDIFALQGSMNIASYTFGPTWAHGPDHARLLCVNAVPSTSPVDLLIADSATHGVARWTIGRAKTVGAGTLSCGGCSVAACIVFNSCNITTVGNLNNRLTSGPATPGGDFCTWQGGANTGCPGAVPTRTTTWGTVKSLYR